MRTPQFQTWRRPPQPLPDRPPDEVIVLPDPETGVPRPCRLWKADLDDPAERRRLFLFVHTFVQQKRRTES